MEDSIPRHFLAILRDGQAELTFPSNHGQLMVGHASEKYLLIYSVKDDTLRFIENPSKHSTNPVVARLLEGRFVVASRKKFVDVVTGFPYVSIKTAPENRVVYVIDSEIFKQRLARTNGYGLIERGAAKNLKLKRRLRNVDLDKYELKILKGLDAYEKYGNNGMSLVFELQQKK